MTSKRVIKLHKMAQKHRGDSDDLLIMKQIADVEHLLDRDRNPRKNLHLDTTKLSLHRDRVEALKRGERIAPVTIDMALTQKCSASCTFCYAGLQQLEAEPVEWSVYEKFLLDCAEVGVKAISLVSDGESTENPHYVDFIVKAKALGIDIALGTNGYRLKDFDLVIPSLTYLRINFNAANPERNASIMGTSVRFHEQVVANIRKAVRVKKMTGSKCTIGLQMVLLPSYADEVIPLALLGRELGVDYLVIKHCSDDEEGRLGVDYQWYRSNIAEQLFRAAEALSTDTYSVQAKWSKFRTGNQRTYSKCYGTPLHLQMSGTGVVAPCGSFFNARYADKHIGDIKTTRFKDILASDRYWEIMGVLKSDGFDPRTDCAQLCLQDRSNVALFDYFERGVPLPAAAANGHRNFL